MENKDLRTPLLSPLLKLAKSSRFLTLVSAAIVLVLVYNVPSLDPIRDDLFFLISTGALALIGGFSLEDAANARRGDGETTQLTIKELLKQLALLGIDVVFEDEPENGETPVA